ncbi:uncharacterized protein LOC143006090 [Genypterus blacodes]|uniref:uncharacterized protein LOC143006090 n=2 Tax=Genypterus blacodes TaxID=154954 RepID=UPI003F75B0FF
MGITANSVSLNSCSRLTTGTGKVNMMSKLSIKRQLSLSLSINSPQRHQLSTETSTPHRDINSPQRHQLSTETSTLHRDINSPQRHQLSTETSTLHRDINSPQRHQLSTETSTLHRLTFTVSRRVSTMGKYITELKVSTNQSEEEKLSAGGFQKINVDLNKGAGGNSIYLWYKKGDCGAITRIQTTFIQGMDVGLIREGYTKIAKNLNAGAGGDDIYLWYFRGSTEYDTAIVDIDVTVDANAEASKFTHGWERVGGDLNRNVGGNWIHTWVKREKQTYICDVTATNGFGIDADNFKEGYIRMDEDVSRGAGGMYSFIWYRQTTDPKKGLHTLEISTTDDEYQQYQQRKLTLVPVNLNEGTWGNKVYLWSKREGCFKPIKATVVLVNPGAIHPFQVAGVRVIAGNLNAGNCGFPEFLCYLT